MPGALAFYGCVAVVGVVVSYLITPETEGRTLEDIEYHFSKNERTLLHRIISIDGFAQNIGNATQAEQKLETISEKVSKIK